MMRKAISPRLAIRILSIFPLADMRTPRGPTLGLAWLATALKALSFWVEPGFSRSSLASRRLWMRNISCRAVKNTWGLFRPLIFPDYCPWLAAPGFPRRPQQHSNRGERPLGLCGLITQVSHQTTNYPGQRARLPSPGCLASRRCIQFRGAYNSQIRNSYNTRINSKKIGIIHLKIACL